MYSDVWCLVEMQRWSVRHWQWNCLSKQSITSIHHGFHQVFQRCNVPSHNTLLLWVSKWHQEGSVKGNKPKGLPLSAPALDNGEWVRDTTLWSLCSSVQRQALALHLHKFSICRIFHRDFSLPSIQNPSCSGT